MGCNAKCFIDLQGIIDVEDTAYCLVKGEKFPIDFNEGSKTVKLILKMYDSNGKKINIE